ncbi:AlbA family DNA-binding domain-containing protein [Burkholderia gladioli]|uniref:AlbA family DNA-binding domain-containing protein n=1 Tax=Burkholderia gladioli TaxID=28095 RepID=UPI001640ACBC|nr:ATP-binding protein [Burkholderia gladioli]
MLRKADIRDVTFDDLLSLKENQVPESHTLDFKRDFPLDRDARVSLACDVAAFANSRGGDLVIGAVEAKGVIEEFKPVALADRDEFLLSLQSALTDLIEPKVPGVHLHAVPMPEGGCVVICRTPPSFHAPHRVRKGGVFYTRTSTGIDPMDITMLRSAFLQSATAMERARAFRQQRLEGVRMAPTRGPLRDGTLAVLHVLPVASLVGGVSIDIETLQNVARNTSPPHANEFGPRINFDGVMSAYDMPGATFSYTQFFRDGSIESVMPVQTGATDVAWIGVFRDDLQNTHHRQLTRALTSIGLDGPAFVMLSFVDIGGIALEDERYASRRFTGMPASVPIKYRNLLVPELFVESFVSTGPDIYPPLFDFVWNAAGLQRSPI